MARKEEAAGPDPLPLVDDRLSRFPDPQADAATIAVADRAVLYRRVPRGSAEEDLMKRRDQAYFSVASQQRAVLHAIRTRWGFRL